MQPNLPGMDYSLLLSWLNAILGQLWPVIAVVIGVSVAFTVYKLYRRAIERD